MTRSRYILIVSIAVIFAGAVSAGLLLWRSAARAEGESKYRSRSNAEWRGLADDADKVAASLLTISSVSDMQGVAQSAAEMRQRVDRAAASLEKNMPPSSYRSVADKEVRALGALASYLEKLNQMAMSGEGIDLQAGRGLLEDRARAAQDGVNDFLAQARWMKTTVDGDFYQAGDALARALTPVDPQLEAQRQSAYDAAHAFMDADIFHHDFDTIFASISNRLKTGFAYYKVSTEKLQADWPKAWDYHPVNFMISKPQITFPSPGNAVVRAIAYVEKSQPKIAEIRLVDEGGWKIDSYPFVGWE